MIFIGVDIGTSATKAVALDDEGRLISRHSIQTGTHDRPDAWIWYRSFQEAVSAVFQEALRTTGDTETTISVTAQGGSFVPLDQDFLPVTRGFCWTSLASQSTVDEMVRDLGAEPVYRRTGWSPCRWLASGKIREWTRSVAGSEGSWTYIAGVPEFIHAQLAQTFVTDVTSAQITGLADFERESWDEDILSWAGIRSSALPAIHSAIDVLFECDARRAISGPVGRMLVLTSSHDQYAAMVASRLVPDGPVMVATGTAWVINGRSREPLYDVQHFQVAPGKDVSGQGYGYIMTAGPVGEGLDRLLARLKMSRKDLAHLPSQDRCSPRGTLRLCPESGLILEQDRGLEDPVYAVPGYMAYVCAKMRWLLETTGRLCGEGSFVMTGGAANSSLWPQILSDVLGRPVRCVVFPEFTAYGAALMGWQRAHPGCLEVPLDDLALTSSYEPTRQGDYDRWYQECQRACLGTETM